MTTGFRDPRHMTLVVGVALGSVIGSAMAIGQGLRAGLLGFAIVFGWSLLTCLLPKGLSFIVAQVVLPPTALSACARSLVRDRHGDTPALWVWGSE